jgi:hypothetical protein
MIEPPKLQLDGTVTRRSETEWLLVSIVGRISSISRSTAGSMAHLPAIATACTRLTGNRQACCHLAAFLRVRRQLGDRTGEALARNICVQGSRYKAPNVRESTSRSALFGVSHDPLMPVRCKRTLRVGAMRTFIGPLPECRSRVGRPVRRLPACGGLAAGPGSGVLGG